MIARATPSRSLEPGMLVAGKYRVDSLLGEGGVGLVYLARHLELDVDVAIKILRPEVATTEDVVRRFAREARASVKLRGEHIARVYDVGVEDGLPYFVMEHLIGCDLLQLIQKRALDVSEFADLMIQACEGLAEAHAQHIVHRDIKPQNLFVVAEGSGWLTLKILDFGISKMTLTGRATDVELAGARTEVMMGTPHYISPEQIRSTHDVDHRADLWSLGVVMFELLSGGAMPFREEHEVTALVAEILEKPHRRFAEVGVDVPSEMEAIIDRCLTKNRDERFQTAAEIAIELLPFAPTRATASVERAVAAMRAAGLGAAFQADTSPAPAPPRIPSFAAPAAAAVPRFSDRSTTRTSLFRLRRRSRRRFVVGALCVAVALGVVGLVWERRTVTKQAPTETATHPPAAEDSHANASVDHSHAGDSTPGLPPVEYPPVEYPPAEYANAGPAPAPPQASAGGARAAMPTITPRVTARSSPVPPSSPPAPPTASASALEIRRQR